MLLVGSVVGERDCLLLHSLTPPHEPQPDSNRKITGLPRGRRTCVCSWLGRGTQRRALQEWVVACFLWKSTDDGAAFARLPRWEAHKFEPGAGQLGCAALGMRCWRVGSSSSRKKNYARQDRTRQDKARQSPPLQAKSWRGGKKMGKGGQEKRSSDHALCGWPGVFLPSSMICSPVRSTPGWSGKRNTWRGPVSFSQSSGRLLYSYESCGTSAQIR